MSLVFFTMCHPYDVRKGSEISPSFFKAKATLSNSGTILPEVNGASSPPFWLEVLSSEYCFANSSKLPF